MEGTFHYLPIEQIELDMENPRIAKMMEMYDKDYLNSEQIALALGSGVEESGQTSYASLYNSIKTNKGIIHPIIVNHNQDGKYVVIEGNTRVQIYKEFRENNIEGNWDKIAAVVHEDLSPQEIHAIRLQSHLVGPREWDPYSKAKYLNYLSNIESLPMSQVIDFCGGKSSEVTTFINAYRDMETYYRPQLESDDEFDQREFSKFVEIQKAAPRQALLEKFSMKDFSKWVIERKIGRAIDVRNLPKILKSDEATKILLKSNIKEAYESVITKEPVETSIKNVSLEALSEELVNRISNLRAVDLKNMQQDDSELMSTIQDIREWCDWIIENVK